MHFNHQFVFLLLITKLYKSNAVIIILKPIKLAFFLDGKGKQGCLKVPSSKLQTIFKSILLSN